MPKETASCRLVMLWALIFLSFFGIGFSSSAFALTQDPLDSKKSAKKDSFPAIELPTEELKDRSILLRGAVSEQVYPQLEKRSNELIEIAFDRQADAGLLTQKGKHFHNPLSVAWAGTRDVMELLTEYKGFEQSSEAGDIILGEKLKIKSRGSADYANQLKRDRIQLELVTAILQLAEGLGRLDESNQQVQANSQIDKGMERLKSLVGEEEADKTFQSLKQWCSSINVDKSIFAAEPMDIIETESLARGLTDNLMRTDPVIADIRSTVHKRFNGRSNIARVTAKVVNFSLSITGYSPTVLAPVSQLAWTIYIATQGGPEEAKLLQEIYLGERFESRLKTLDACAKLAVNSHFRAQTTKNPALLAVSEWMIDQASIVHRMPVATKPSDDSPDIFDQATTAAEKPPNTSPNYGSETIVEAASVRN